MARHNGSGGIVKHGTAVLDGLTNWTIDETVDRSDSSAAGDTWKDHVTGLKGWSGTIDLRLDHDIAANQTLRAGDPVALELYSEGDATGKSFFQGQATITDVGVQSPHNDVVSRRYSFEGKGALSITTVGP